MDILSVLAYKLLYDWINHASTSESATSWDIHDKHEELKKKISDDEKKHLDECKKQYTKWEIDDIINSFNI